MKRLVWICVVSLFCFSQSAEDVALRLENNLRALQTFEARYEHIYYSAIVSTPLREKGKFYFKKPNLMRWESIEPENNIYLYKGNKFQYYFPEDNQLMRGSLLEEESEIEILDILTGEKNLLDFYSVEFSPFPTESPKNAQVKLIPKEEDNDSFILLEIDKRKWVICRAIFIDWEGNKKEFQFSRIKTNHSLPRDIFKLKIPKDVDIFER